MRRIFGVVILTVFISVNSFAQDDTRPKQPDLPGDIMLDFGFNFWDNQPDNLPAHAWGSNSFGIYYNQRVRFNDHISMHLTPGFTFEKYSFNSTYSWLNQQNGTVSLDSLTGVAMEKNKLVANYLEIPVEFRIHPLGTVNGEGWFIGLGFIGGARIGAHTKVKYNLGDNTVKEKVYDDFGINSFRYGYQIRFGFKSFHLFYKSYLNDVFKSAPSADGVLPRAFTFGMTFSGF